MAAYNEIDGVYCHRNAWLLRDVLRGEMGFDGIVMADGLAVDFLKIPRVILCMQALQREKPVWM